MLIDIISGAYYAEAEEVSFQKNNIWIQGFGWTDSEDNFADYCLKSGKNIHWRNLFGAFSVFLALEDENIVFTDNSNLQCIYISDHAISDSFLEIIRHEKNKYGTNLHFDEDALTEYMVLGKYFFNKTLIKEIRKSRSDEYYIISCGKISVHKKGIGDISEPSEVESIPLFFKLLNSRIAGRKILLAQTGGYDSRLINVLMDPEQNIQLFMEGNNVLSSDYLIAKKVAENSNRPFEYYGGDERRELTENLVREIFSKRDGMCFAITPSLIRAFDYTEYFNSKGYSLQFTGDGGVLHKDWEWMQDLPFYHKHSVNVRKFYSQRIAYAYKSKGLTNRIMSNYSNVKETICSALENLAKGHSNTESYDLFYYYVSSDRSESYHIHDNGFSKYAPLTEFELVKYSYHLPRRKRFFYNQMRSIITKANKKIARMPTNYDTTASSEFIYIIRDVFVQLKEYFVKMHRMVYRKIFKTNPKDNNSVWNVEKLNLTQLALTQKAYEYCRKQDILDAKYSINEYDNDRLSQMICLYLLSETCGMTDN